jgi:DNA-binding IscR family transcriptional regulator
MRLTTFTDYSLRVLIYVSVHPAECFEADSNACAITPDCRLKFALSDAVEAFYRTLRRHTLADVVRNPRALAKVLVIQPPPGAAAQA